MHVLHLCTNITCYDIHECVFDSRIKYFSYMGFAREIGLAELFVIFQILRTHKQFGHTMFSSELLYGTHVIPELKTHSLVS